MRWNGAGGACGRSVDHEVGGAQDRVRDGETVSKTHPTLADLKRRVVMALGLALFASENHWWATLAGPAVGVLTTSDGAATKQRGRR